MARRGTRIAGILAAAGLLGAVGLAVWLTTRPRSPEEVEAAAIAQLARVHVTVTAGGISLAATHAVADFGIDEGVKRVLVRIVDDLVLHVRIEADEDVGFAEVPRLCLVGPFAAPDDAGLSDRCWGEPDLAVPTGQLVTDADGRPALRGGTPVTFTTALQRGDVRCDYPPGAWVLEVRVVPLVDGTAAGPHYLDDAPVTIPHQHDGPLEVVDRSRYCGLASLVYREQGEPTVIEGR